MWYYDVGICNAEALHYVEQSPFKPKFEGLNPAAAGTLIKQWGKKFEIGLHHPRDGVTNPKYKLLFFIHLTIFLQKEEGTSF
jgi:hypothetical protein